MGTYGKHTFIDPVGQVSIGWTRNFLWKNILTTLISMQKMVIIAKTFRVDMTLPKSQKFENAISPVGLGLHS